MALASLLALSACATADRTAPPVRSWGTVREVLGGGQTQARVALGDLTSPGVFAVGALAALAGEVTIADGEVWASRVVDGVATTERSRAPGGSATLLFSSTVSAWHQVPVERDVSAVDFDAFVAAQAHRLGFDPAVPFAFQVVGPLRDLRLHVIAGDCPVRAKMLGREPKAAPLRLVRATVSGRLIGIYARDGGGKFSHHGRATHVHAILEDAAPLTGHVDAVGIGRGAVLFLPLR